MALTTEEFILKAKKAVVFVNKDARVESIEIVWYNHTLGNKKAILIDGTKNSKMYEVTYNGNKNELYVDIYEKERNLRLPA